MITPSHLIYSWALARKTEKNNDSDQKRTLAFVLGALFPDTPTYIFFLVCGVILGIPHEILWDDMYFNSGWSIPINLTHSFIIWPIVIAFSGYFGWKLLKWFSISAFFHSIVDFFVHTDDAYRHFYPFSDWKFKSPVSYWNNAEYGQYVSFFDSTLVIALLVYLYTKYQHKSIRMLIVVLGTLYALRLVAEPFVMLYMHQ
jgi:hypothetical protein